MALTIDPSSQQFLDSVNNIWSALNTAQSQLSTGKKVNQPSDAPDAISPILQLYAQIQHNQDIQTNLGTVQTSVGTAEQALSSSVDLLQSASVIATEATSTSQTADTRATLAQSVQGILQQLVANSNTTVSGRYVFSGDQDQVSLYQLDPTNLVTGVSRAQIATNTNLVQGPGGAQYSASLTANDIFDHRTTTDPTNPDAIAPDNVFAALTGLRVALQNNDTTGINTSITSLQTASTYMNNELAFYGQAQDRVTQGVTQTQNNDVAYRTQLSGLQDADATEAITSLTQAQTELQAALAARARMPQTSLFSVLPNS
jgi:flagellar hook-associated protein 3 FlgL